MVDHYQGQGVGTALMGHLVTIARGAGLKELVAEGDVHGTGLALVWNW